MPGTPLRVRFAPGTKHRIKRSSVVWTVQEFDSEPGEGTSVILVSDSGRAELFVNTRWCRKNLRAVPKGKKP